MSNFSSLEWTFIDDTIIPTSTDGRATITVLGSGPNLYVSVKHLSGSGDHKPFEVGIQLRVFEKTWVRGFLHLFNGYAMIWGDSYIAHFPVHQLLEGGTVCRKNILSTGRQIMGMRPHSRAMFSIYYADGSVDALASCEIRQSKTCTIHPLNILRLPLKPTETVTAAYTRTLTTYLGTSHGRLIAIKELTLIYKREPVINRPVKQIIRSFWGNGSQNSTVLCFENGSIVAWNKNQWTEVKGRYTCISFFPIGMAYPLGNHNNHVLAGDMDGNVTVFRVSPGQIVPYRTVRCLTLNPITVLDNVGERAEMLIGAKMGELQLIDAQSFDMNGHPPNSRPGCVDDSRCFYKTRNGWYFLINDQLWKAFKCMSPDSGDAAKPMEKYFEAKNMKIKYLCCSGRPHREIIFAYSRQGYFARVTEYPGDNEAIEYSGGHHTADPIIIIQVILMQSYILIQLDSGIVQLFHIGDMRKTNRLEPASHFKTSGRITAAALIGNSGPPLDLMVAYLDCRVEVGQAGWNGVMISNFHFSPVPMDLRGSHIVSMIYSQGHIGISQCILLSRKGIVYIAANSTLDHYVAVHQQDLSPIIGRGHSLIETVWGILAVGFKQNTLHVCWISLAAFVPCQYRHLFSVDTRSSRLPFTIASCCSCPSCCWGLSVSYHHKDGFKEDRFPFLETPVIHGFKHSGIITTCLQPDMEDPNGNKLIHTGDTEGRFCTWAIGQKNVHGQGYINDYKLNGAVAGLVEMEDCIAVATSQGDLHLFKLFSIKPFLFFPLIPYNMGQKISYMMKFDSLANTFLLVFLGDGTAQQVKLEKRKSDKFTVAECITAKKVARFPVPTKMALCIKQEKDYYIIALGIDGILRRTQTGGNITIEMSWKISAIKNLLINSVKILMVGDPSGRVYFLITDSEMENNFYSDRLHHHEIIDVLFHTPDGKDYVFCSLDISGTVAIRRMVIGKPSRYRPELWSCPVPSPRKIEIVGERQIMVVGRGVATKNF